MDSLCAMRSSLVPRFLVPRVSEPNVVPCVPGLCLRLVFTCYSSCLFPILAASRPASPDRTVFMKRLLPVRQSALDRCRHRLFFFSILLERCWQQRGPPVGVWAYRWPRVGVWAYEGPPVGVWWASRCDIHRPAPLTRTVLCPALSFKSVARPRCRQCSPGCQLPSFLTGK